MDNGCSMVLNLGRSEPMLGRLEYVSEKFVPDYCSHAVLIGAHGR